LAILNGFLNFTTLPFFFLLKITSYQGKDTLFKEYPFEITLCIVF